MDVQRKLIQQFNYEIEKIEEEENANKNISIAFDGMGKFGELLATYIFKDSIGSASKGGCAFDNHCLKTNIKREIKTCCIIQPKTCKTCVAINKEIERNYILCTDCELIKKCNKCDKKTTNRCLNCEIKPCDNCLLLLENKRQIKVPYFQKKCIFCESSEEDNFSYTKDSRFGIDCKSHFQYEAKLNEYLFNLIDYKDNNIIFESFIINSNNNYFTNMLRNQLEKGSGNNCNLLPKNHDFYSSGPVKILEMIYSRDKKIIKFDFNPKNKIICQYPITLLPKNITFPKDKTHIPYEELEHLLIQKKKSFGKKRGKTTRIG